MKKAIVLTVGLVMVAGMALASNTGFKLNYPLGLAAGTSSSNWVSFPYFYFPNGNVGAAVQTAQDMCVDFNGAPKDTSKVFSISRWVTTSDGPFTKFCSNAGFGFNLAAGEGYNVVPTTAAITLAIVGSHDDEYSANKAGASVVQFIYAPGTSSSNWVSVPYHSIADNAQDFCVAFNGAPKDTSKVISISRWVTSGDGPFTKFCSNAGFGFDLTPGEALNFVPNTATYDAQFDVY
jgi:hypothetical protein